MPTEQSKISQPQDVCLGALQLISGMYSSSDGSDDEMEMEQKTFQDIDTKDECIIHEVMKKDKSLVPVANTDKSDFAIVKKEVSNDQKARDEKSDREIPCEGEMDHNLIKEEKVDHQAEATIQVEKALQINTGQKTDQQVLIKCEVETFENQSGTFNGAVVQLGDSQTFTGSSYSEPRVSTSEKIKTECTIEDSDSDSVSSLDSTEDSSDSDSESEAGDSLKKNKQQRAPDMTYSDLPPIEDLHISVPHEKCKLVGNIKSVVDPLVIVESIKNLPVLNLDSVLFLDKGDRSLGHIFDVIGKVEQPHYCVRFNSKEHIEKNGVHPGMPVYCAPSTDYTAYVFLAQLRQLKGTDASWKDDYEPPKEEQEFSDDDSERMAKNGGRKRKTKKKIPTENDAKPSQYFGTNQSNGNQRRGFKRPQGYNHSQQQQNGSNNYQSRFVPPFVAGFAPPHPFRPPPFNAYGHPRPFFPRMPPMEYNRLCSFNGGPNQRFENTHFMNNRCPPPPQPHFNPSHQQYSMWGTLPHQQNYWQRPPVMDTRNSPATSSNVNRDEQNSKLPPPPGV